MDAARTSQDFSDVNATLVMNETRVEATAQVMDDWENEKRKNDT